MKTRTPYRHLERAYAHLTKAYTQLHEETGRQSGGGDVALFTKTKAALDATEEVRKATRQALNTVRLARDAGLRFDAGSTVEGLFLATQKNIADARRCFFEDDRQQRATRLLACIDGLDRLAKRDRGELQAYFKNARRLDDLLAVFRAATEIKELRIVERGGGRPTSGDADLFASEIVRRVLQLRNKIAHE